MKEYSEAPRSAEQLLNEKKEKLKESVDLMKDWEKGKRIKETFLPYLDNLTDEEVNYCSLLVEYSNTRIQLRGPFASTASKMLYEQEKEIKEMEKNIESERAKELKKIMTGA